MSYIGNSPGVASQRVETAFTATSNQTAFTPSSGYTLGYCDVYQNGVKLVNGDDYTASDGVTVTLATGAASGDSIVIVASFPRGLTDGYLKSEADAKYVALTGAQTVAGVKTFSSQIVGIAGTAGAPAVTTTGDTDTGIFFPAANTLAFSTNGTEDARFDANGKFLIGGNASDLSSTTQAMVMGSGGLAVQHAGTTGTYLKVTPGAADGVVDVRADARSGGYPALTFTTGAAERARIDASGNWGLGISSNLSARLTVNGRIDIGANWGTDGSTLHLENDATASNGAQIRVSYWGGGPYGPLRFNVGGSERARIAPNGNFIFNGTSDAALSGVSGISIGSTSATNAGIGFCTSGRQYLVGTLIGSPYVNSLIIYDSTVTSERFRINPSGFVKANVNGTFHDAAAAYHEFNQPFNGVNSVIFRTTGSSPYGPWVSFSGAAPNNATNYFLAGSDQSVLRFAFFSNGGLHNYQANNSNLSDRREKTNFEPAGSYLEKICAIPVQTFNYIDQNMEEDGGLTLGVVAQDVQAVAPELVTESDWGTKEEPKMRLSIYQTDLQYALMKSIQELKAIVDAQAAEIATLKGQS
jgi:hypothetical protein